MKISELGPVGILGSGQLARMLLLEAAPLGLQISVFAAHNQDPAAQVCGQSHLGSMEDIEDLRKFLRPLKAVTFESEFVDTHKMQKCLPAELNVFPKLEVISQIQDRLTQKQLLDQFGIATSPWMEVQDKADLQEAEKRFPKGFVLKARRFGYDGYGTFVFRQGKAHPDVLQKSKYGFIAEAFVPFQREVAMLLVRSRSDEFRALPLVESVQVQSRCFSVAGPITHRSLKKVQTQFRNLMRKLDYVGVLAVELFDNGKELVVNELAPRVHNSAHYSLNGLTCSQFEYHWRAGLDLPLPKVELVRPGFAMVNLLGEGGEISLSYAPKGFLHWYGKGENRAGRKLGHINTLGSSPGQALRKALEWRKDFQL